MNIEHLRRAIKVKWLTYYRDNRDWIMRLGVWVNCEGQRRPSSSFILATLAAIEPQLNHLLPFVVDLSSNPDRIVMALGLNFNPDEQLDALAEAEKPPSYSQLSPPTATALTPGKSTSLLAGKSALPSGRSSDGRSGDGRSSDGRNEDACQGTGTSLPGSR